MFLLRLGPESYCDVSPNALPQQMLPPVRCELAIRGYPWPEVPPFGQSSSESDGICRVRVRHRTSLGARLHKARACSILTGRLIKSGPSDGHSLYRYAGI